MTMFQRRVVILGVAAFNFCGGVAISAENVSPLSAAAVSLLQDKGAAGLDEAVVLFKKALQADAGAPEALQGLADALILKYELAQGKDPALLKEAIEKLDILLKAKPGSGRAYLSRATAEFDLGNEAAGVRDLQKAVLLDPLDRRASMAYFCRLLDTGEKEKAADFAVESLPHFMNSAVMLRVYGDGFMKAGETEAGLRLYRAAAEAAPDNAMVALAQADALRAAGKAEEAAAAYEKAVKLEPKAAAALFGLGCSRAGLGDYGKAIEAMRQCLGLTPDDAAAVNNLAMYLEKAGKADEARTEWKRLKSLPGATEVHRKRADDRLSAGK